MYSVTISLKGKKNTSVEVGGKYITWKNRHLFSTIWYLITYLKLVHYKCICENQENGISFLKVLQVSIKTNNHLALTKQWINQADNWSNSVKHVMELCHGDFRFGSTPPWLKIRKKDLTNVPILPQTDPNNILYCKAFLFTKKKHSQGFEIYLCVLSVEYEKNMTL